MRKTLFTRIVAAALAAVLIVLAPGLEPYRVFADAFMVGASGGVPIRGWLGVMNNSFGGMNLSGGAAAPHLGGASNQSFLRHLGGFDFQNLSNAERRAIAPVVQYLVEKKGLSPERFQALSTSKQEAALAEAVAVVAEDVQEESGRLIDAVSEGKLDGYELQAAHQRLKDLSASGIYYMETADQHRVIEAKTVAAKRLEAKRTGGIEAKIRGTASKLGNGISTPNPVSSLRTAWDRWKLNRLSNPKEHRGVALFNLKESLKSEVKDEKSMWQAVDGALDRYNLMLDGAELALKLGGEPGRVEQAKRLVKAVKEDLPEFQAAAEAAKSRIKVEYPQYSRYMRSASGDISGARALAVRIGKIEATRPAVEGQKRSFSYPLVIAMAAAALLAAASIALGDTGPMPEAPTLAERIVTWINLNFTGELKSILIGTTGTVATFWLSNKVRSATRYLVDKFSELRSEQKNIVVGMAGLSVLMIGLSKTLVFMGLDYALIGKAFAGGVAGIGLTYLISLLTKAPAPGTTAGASLPFANHIAGTIMAFDPQFKVGDEITVKLDGETIKGIVLEIGWSRTRVQITKKGVSHEELLGNNAILALNRIGRKGEGRPDRRNQIAQTPAPKEQAPRAPPTVSLKAVAAVGTGAVLVAAAILSQPAVVPAAILTAGLIVSILVHEAAHLWALRRLGDDTAALHGVTSINPLKQIDPVGTVLMPAASLLLTSMTGLPIMFGWAKAVPVDFNKLADPKNDPAKVALAGPKSNIALAALSGAAWVALLFLAPASTALMIAAGLCKINLALAVYNMMPLTPTHDGFKYLVSKMSDDQYSKWTRNPNLPEEYQKTYGRLFEGPSNILSRLHIHSQPRVNGLTRALVLAGWSVVALALVHFVGMPLLFLVLPCSYDYYCIREKIQNEAAVNEIRDIMRAMAASLAKAAEESDEIKSEIDTYEVEHILKNALEDLVDQVVDSEGFSQLDDAQKWDRFLAQYKDAAVKALHENPKGMAKDSPEAIRRLLESETGKQFFDKIRQWIDRNEVWSKWKSPKRKGTGLGEAVRKDKTKDSNGISSRRNGVAPETPAAEPAKKKTFEEALNDPAIGMSDKEKGFLLLHLKEMTQEHKPPVVGRVDEMDQLVTTVTSPRGVINSVVLVGKAGVGKTAVAEKLAQAMAVSETPNAGTFSLKRLNGRYLVKLNLGRLLQSDDPAKALDLLLQLLGKLNDGDKRKGNKVLLFIDEVHQIFEHPKGAQMANLLKEPLRDGEITIIAATTENEYRQYMEKDDAFQRRLIRIDLKESTTPETMRALQGTKGYYEGLFELSISPEALKAAAEMSKYDQEVFLPGRAFKYLVLAASQASFDGQRDRASLRIQDAMSDLQYAMGELSRHLAKKSLITQDLKEQEPTAIELYNWVVELTKKIVDLYKKRDAIPTSGTPALTDEMVKEEIARKTGVASGQLTMGNEPMEKYLKMEETLSKRVVGQEEPVGVISEAVRKNKAGLSDPKRPLGVFYLTGPTGTGKTHLAKELARFLFKDPDAVIRIDMSEYMEGHSVSRMIGSPPGYVGHDAGGQLTEAVRKRPYSVVLFDEIEKAHQDVWDILLQITGDGRLTDGKGRTVDFKNTIILMTSNLGMNAIDVAPYEKEYSEVKAKIAALNTLAATGADVTAERAALEAQKHDVARRLAEDTKRQAKEVTEKAFKEVYRPEFQGRLHAPPIVFNRISPAMADQIVDLNLKELASVLTYAGHELSWTPEVSKFLADEGFSVSLGARPLQNTIERLVTQSISGEILKAAVANGEKVQPSAISLSIVDGKVKIAVNPLPAKVVARQDAEEGASRELFTKILQQVLEAASKGIVPNIDVQTLDKWATETLLQGVAPKNNPLPTGEVAQSAGEGAPAVTPFFGENESLPLSPKAHTAAASNNDARSKDAGLLAARKAVAAALEAKGMAAGSIDLLLRTFEEEGKPYVGWLKLLSTHAKEMSEAGAAPVVVRYEAGKTAKLVLHRQGTVGEKEAELLKRHFSGPVPADRDGSFGKAETWNVMGKLGKEHWLELYRLLNAIPGARLGYATGDKADGGTDYWVEIPMTTPQAAPIAVPLPTGEVARSAGEGAPIEKTTMPGFGENDLQVEFGPGMTYPEISEILLAHGLGGGGQYLGSTDGSYVRVGLADAAAVRAKAAEMAAVPKVTRLLVYGRHAKIKIEKKLNAHHVKVLFGPNETETSASTILERMGFTDRFVLNHRDNGRGQDWTRWATVEALSKEEAASTAGRLAELGSAVEIRVNAKISAMIGEPTGPPTDIEDGGHASARPAPGTENSVPEAGPANSPDLHTLARQLLMAMHRQGDQRGPTLRMSIAEALAAISTPEDLTLARDWIRFENMERHYPEIIAAALILAKHGRRAEDEPRLRRAMRFLNAQYGHQYNPAKSLVAGAYASLQATGTNGGRKLLKRYEDEKVRTSYSDEADEDHQQNALVVEAMYQALARYGDETAWERLKADWSDEKHSEALYLFAKREKPGVLKRLYDGWKRTGDLPEGADRMLTLNAIADLGTVTGESNDVEKLKELLFNFGRGDALDDFHVENGAEAYGRLVTRLGVYASIRNEVRSSAEADLSANGNFRRVIWAVKTMSEAGDAADLPVLEQLMRINPEHIHYYHEMTQHAAVIAWANIVNREGRLSDRLPKLMEMLGDTNAVINKAAVEALKLHLATRKQSPLPAERGEVARSAGEGIEAVPPQPAHPFFSDSASPEAGTTYFGTDDEIESNSNGILSRLPEETRRNAREWVSCFSIILEAVLHVGFQRDLRVVTGADGKTSLYFVLREAVTTEFEAGLADNARRVVLSVLNERGNNYASAVRALAYLQGALGAKMGFSRDPGRRYEANRGEMELWLKLDVPGSGSNAPYTPPQPTRRRNPRLDRIDDMLDGIGGHMGY